MNEPTNKVDFRLNCLFFCVGDSVLELMVMMMMTVMTTSVGADELITLRRKMVLSSVMIITNVLRLHTTRVFCLQNYSFVTIIIAILEENHKIFVLAHF